MLLRPTVEVNSRYWGEASDALIAEGIPGTDYDPDFPPVRNVLDVWSFTATPTDGRTFKEWRIALTQRETVYDTSGAVVSTEDYVYSLVSNDATVQTSAVFFSSDAICDCETYHGRYGWSTLKTLAVVATAYFYDSDLLVYDEAANQLVYDPSTNQLMFDGLDGL